MCVINASLQLFNIVFMHKRKYRMLQKLMKFSWRTYSVRFLIVHTLFHVFIVHIFRLNKDIKNNYSLQAFETSVRWLFPMSSLKVTKLKKHVSFCVSHRLMIIYQKIAFYATAMLFVQ